MWNNRALSNKYNQKYLCKFIILNLIISVMFSGCSTSSKDGPPGYKIDANKIADAKPKFEKRSKHGNMPSYLVLGKKYYVMSTSVNYKEQGIASWYGKKFHSRNTSSGEKYNMLAMTAAHKSLPLPTYVEVTNLSNHKKVIVKVNDRGPFLGNRLIDLSYAAALKLGMLGHGTARVEVRAINPNNSERGEFIPRPAKKILLAQSVSIKKSNKVFVQVGAFHSKLAAEKLRQRVASIISSPVKITQIKNKTLFYRVQIGPLQDPLLISQINRKLKSIGLDGKEMWG